MKEAQQPARPPHKSDAGFPQEFRSADELHQHYRKLKNRMRNIAPRPKLPVPALEPPAVSVETPPEVKPPPHAEAILSLEETPPFICRAEILRAVAEAMKLTVQEIQSHSRFRRLVDARFVYYVMARKYSGASLPQIGFAVGYRDHSTVLHGLRQGARRFSELLPIYKAVSERLGIPLPDVSDFLEVRE